jgi:hypothetical protein
MGACFARRLLADSSGASDTPLLGSFACYRGRAVVAIRRLLLVPLSALIGFVIVRRCLPGTMRKLYVVIFLLVVIVWSLIVLNIVWELHHPPVTSFG